jgi:hypothetical protein
MFRNNQALTRGQYEANNGHTNAEEEGSYEGIRRPERTEPRGLGDFPPRKEGNEPGGLRGTSRKEGSYEVIR